MRTFRTQPRGASPDYLPRPKLAGALHGAFPDYRLPPASGGECGMSPNIVAAVTFDLVPPELRPRGRPTKKRAVVAMPKAPMRKDYGTPSRQDNIRTPWKEPLMQTKPEAPGMQSAPEKQFRFRVYSTNARHHPASDLRCNDISHRQRSVFARSEREFLPVAFLYLPPLPPSVYGGARVRQPRSRPARQRHCQTVDRLGCRKREF